MDDEYYERDNAYRTNSESTELTMLNGQQKKDAKLRAKKRLQEMEKHVLIARSNYLQLGGKLEDVLPDETKNEHAVMK
jgi:hypothetical protein